MENENKKTQIISFLSGKGGAGKTSASIGVSYLLNDAGFNVLLIDFDFATNGASYFYKYLYRDQKAITGLYELLSDREFNLDKITSKDFDNVALKIKEGLYFIPSRVNFSKKLPLRDSVIVKEKNLEIFLLYLIDFYKKNYDFIIIDNQAGSNLTSKISATISDKVIIVSELDPISSDAVDSLLIQIGDSFPEYRRHLINKLNISEISDYKDLSMLFQSMNRLPPLPFDFEVRTAFASRKIPIDTENPTTFSIALFNTVKSFLPEYREKIDQYGEKILEKFNLYQNKLQSLLDNKKTLKREIESLRERREKKNIKFQKYMAISIVYIGVILTMLSVLSNVRGYPPHPLLDNPFFFGGILLAFSGLFYAFYVNMKVKEEKEKYKTLKIESELLEINKEIDRYKSLILTRTKEFLLHFEKETLE